MFLLVPAHPGCPGQNTKSRKTGWNKFRQLLPLLTNNDISLIVRGDCTAVVCKVVCCMEVRPGP